MFQFRKELASAEGKLRSNILLLCQRVDDFILRNAQSQRPADQFIGTRSRTEPKASANQPPANAGNFLRFEPVS
jgi:hypothetical protein